MKLFGGRSSRASGRRLISSSRDAYVNNTASTNAQTAAGEGKFRSMMRIKHVRVAVIVTVILALLGGGFALAWQMIKLPDLPVYPETGNENKPTFDVAPKVSPAPVSDVTPDSANTLRKAGCYTFLLAGLDNGDGGTDSIMVAMLDTDNKTLNVMSIPRDTMVNVNRSVKKINGAYMWGNIKNKGDGPKALIAEIETILGFTPDFYAVVNMKGFVELVDTVDGVEFDVPMKMYKVLDDMTINLKKGKQTLSGKQALQLVRWRDYPGKDDYGRMEVQQEFLMTIAKKVLSLESVFKINEFVDIASENLETNLKIFDMTSFANVLMTFDSDNIQFHTMPSTVGTYKKGSYVYVDVEKTLDMVNEFINPYNKPFTEDDLDILILKD